MTRRPCVASHPFPPCSGLTVELTDELGFVCNASGLTIWLLSSREEYDACTATEEGSRRLRVCEKQGDEFALYLVSDNPQNIVQEDSFIRLKSHQTEVYVACELCLCACVCLARGTPGGGVMSPPPLVVQLCPVMGRALKLALTGLR